MSLATMKRKTHALKGNVSSGGFSISNVNRPEPKCVYNCSVVKKMYNHTQSEYLNEKKLNIHFECDYTFFLPHYNYIHILVLVY
jgi:hypothetical protein